MGTSIYKRYTILSLHNLQSVVQLNTIILSMYRIYGLILKYTFKQFIDNGHQHPRISFKWSISILSLYLCLLLNKDSIFTPIRITLFLLYKFFTSALSARIKNDPRPISSRFEACYIAELTHSIPFLPPNTISLHENCSAHFNTSELAFELRLIFLYFANTPCL